MFRRKSYTDKLITGVLLGGFVGSILTLLFTPKSGKEVRDDISDTYDETIDKGRKIKNSLVEETSKLTKDLIAKSEELLSMARDYAAGIYEGTADSFTQEFNRLKRAINAGLDTYKNYDMITGTSQDENTIEEMMSNYDDEDLPKSEGMGRRV